jgi:tryptophan-rich sensory protein
MQRTRQGPSFAIIVAGFVGLSVAWAAAAAFAYVNFQDELFRFLSTYLSPDGELTSPGYTLFRIAVAPIFLALYALVAMVTFRAWPFPKTLAGGYLLFFLAHFLIYFYYIKIVLGGGDPEDSLLEWGTFVLSFLGGVLFLAAGILGVRVAFVFGLSWLFFGFEEISWGQRVFGIETPDLLKEYNYQEELNLHNLVNPIQSYLYVPLNALLLCGLTWMRKPSWMAWLYRMGGLRRVMHVSDRYGLWMIPAFLIFAYFFPGPEFVEEQWAIFGFVLSVLLLVELREERRASARV